MPSSAITFDNLFQVICHITNPASVFDFGAGAGKYGKIVKLLKESGKLATAKTVAIEIDNDYINAFGLRLIYDEIVNLNLQSIVGDGSIHGDIAVLGDVIEHLPKSKGIDLCEFLMYQFKYIYVVTPVDMKQDSWHGKNQEMHISRWLEHDFTKYPNTSCIRKDGMILAIINGIDCKREELLEVKIKGEDIILTLPERNGIILAAKST